MQIYRVHVEDTCMYLNCNLPLIHYCEVGHWHTSDVKAIIIPHLMCP